MSDIQNSTSTMPDDAIIGYDVEGEVMFPPDERDDAYSALIDSLEGHRRQYDVDAAVGIILAHPQPVAFWEQFKTVVDRLVEREGRRRIAAAMLLRERADDILRNLGGADPTHGVVAS